MPPVTLNADGVAANSGCDNPTNAIGSPDGVWTGNDDATDWTCRWTMTDPDGTLTGLQTVTVTVRKSAALGTDPSVTVTLYEADTPVKTLVATTTLADATSPAGIELAGTFMPDDLSGDGNDVQVHITSDGVGTVLPRNVHVDSIVWDASVVRSGHRPQSDYRRSIRFRGHPR